MSKQITETVTLLKNEQVAPNLFIATFKAPLLSRLGEPGNWMDIYPSARFEHSRSFSFFGIDPQAQTIQAYYFTRGIGTHFMAEQWKIGDQIKINGPMGKAFHYGDNQKTLIVGAGVGLAPMKCLVEALQRHNRQFEVLIGARSASYLKALEYFPKNVDFKIVTDDGSVGEKKSVIEKLEQILADDKNEEIDSIVACGPDVVLYKIDALAKKHGAISQSAVAQLEICPFENCYYQHDAKPNQSHNLAN